MRLFFCMKPQSASGALAFEVKCGASFSLWIERAGNTDNRAEVLAKSRLDGSVGAQLDACWDTLSRGRESSSYCWVQGLDFSNLRGELAYRLFYVERPAAVCVFEGKTTCMVAKKSDEGLTYPTGEREPARALERALVLAEKPLSLADLSVPADGQPETPSAELAALLQSLESELLRPAWTDDRKRGIRQLFEQLVDPEQTAALCRLALAVNGKLLHKAAHPFIESELSVKGGHSFQFEVDEDGNTNREELSEGLSEAELLQLDDYWCNVEPALSSDEPVEISTLDIGDPQGNLRYRIFRNEIDARVYEAGTTKRVAGSIQHSPDYPPERELEAFAIQRAYALNDGNLSYYSFAKLEKPPGMLGHQDTTAYARLTKQLDEMLRRASWSDERKLQCAEAFEGLDIVEQRVLLSKLARAVRDYRLHTSEHPLLFLLS